MSYSFRLERGNSPVCSACGLDYIKISSKFARNHMWSIYFLVNSAFANMERSLIMESYGELNYTSICSRNIWSSATYSTATTCIRLITKISFMSYILMSIFSIPLALSVTKVTSGNLYYFFIELKMWMNESHFFLLNL